MQSSASNTRAIVNIVFGLILIIFGIFVFYKHQFAFVELDTIRTYGMGILLCVYGAFRVYRGLVTFF